MTPSDLITQGRDLTSHVDLPVDAQPHELVEALIQARGQLDRLSELMSVAQMYRSHAKQLQAATAEAAEHSWDTAATSARKVKRGNDFEGAKERYSEFNLRSFDEKVTARKAADEHDLWNSAFFIVRQQYQNLDGFRLDIHLRMRAFTIESSLER